MEHFYVAPWQLLTKFWDKAPMLTCTHAGIHNNNKYCTRRPYLHSQVFCFGTVKKICISHILNVVFPHMHRINHTSKMLVSLQEESGLMCLLACKQLAYLHTKHCFVFTLQFWNWHKNSSLIGHCGKITKLQISQGSFFPSGYHQYAF